MGHNKMRILEVVSSPSEQLIYITYDKWYDKVKVTRLLLNRFKEHENRVFKVQEHHPFYQSIDGICDGKGRITIRYANSFDDLSQ